MEHFKRTMVLLMLCLAVYLPVFATPPENIILKFDTKDKVVSIGVVHLTDKPDKHFIKEIKVKLNGKNIVTQNFSAQPDGNGQTVSYVVFDAQLKDNIEVRAACNSGKSITKAFKLE